MKGTAYCDGSGGSPRGSSAAAVLYDENGDWKAEVARPLPLCSNNIAEYTGVILALQLALENGVDHLEIFSDSQLIVRQLNGQWEIKKKEFIPFRDQVWELAHQFQWASLSWVPREENEAADALCTQMLDLEPTPSLMQSLLSIFPAPQT